MLSRTVRRRVTRTLHDRAARRIAADYIVKGVAQCYHLRGTAPFLIGEAGRAAAVA
jgi:hypothetical protein